MILFILLLQVSCLIWMEFADIKLSCATLCYTSPCPFYIHVIYAFTSLMTLDWQIIVHQHLTESKRVDRNQFTLLLLKRYIHFPLPRHHLRSKDIKRNKALYYNQFPSTRRIDEVSISGEAIMVPLYNNHLSITPTYHIYPHN